MRIITNLWQPGEPCKLLKTLNIYGLKGHCSGQPAQLIVNILQQRSFIIRKPVGCLFAFRNKVTNVSKTASVRNVSESPYSFLFVRDS